MHHTVCIHITCLATHCSANYPTLCGSGDNNYHQTLGADEVACMKWSSDPDSFLLCLRFALFVSFIFCIFFSTLWNCPFGWAPNGSACPKESSDSNFPSGSRAPAPPQCSCAESKASALPSPLFRSAFSPVSLPLRLAGTVATPPWLHNLATTQMSPNSELIIQQFCSANCKVFVGILNAFRPN